MRRTSWALLAAGLAAAVAALAGCTDTSEPAGPAPSTPAATSPAPAATLPTTIPTSGAGSDGLTVRYLGPDGKVRTLPAEDFPR